MPSLSENVRLEVRDDEEKPKIHVSDTFRIIDDWEVVNKENMSLTFSLKHTLECLSLFLSSRLLWEVPQ